MDVQSILSRKNVPAATLALWMRPFRAGAHSRCHRSVVFSSLVLLLVLFDFLIVRPSEWSIASALLCLGMAYPLTAKIPMRTRLFRVLPTTAVLLAVALAAAPVPNSRRPRAVRRFASFTVTRDRPVRLRAPNRARELGLLNGRLTRRLTPAFHRPNRAVH